MNSNFYSGVTTDNVLHDSHSYLTCTVKYAADALSSSHEWLHCGHSKTTRDVSYDSHSTPNVSIQGCKTMLSRTATEHVHNGAFG